MKKKVKLGEICNILNGYAFKSKEYVEDGIRVIRITNVQKGIIEDSDPKYYAISKTDKLKNYMLKEKDLLISLTGNVGRVGLMPKEFLPAGLNQRVGCIRIKDSQNISIEYLYQYLNSDKFERECINNSNGIAQKNLSTEWLKNYMITVPSIEEQNQIANKLKQLQRISKLKKQQKELLDELIKSQFVEMFGKIERQKELKEYISSLDAGKSLAGEKECKSKVLKTGSVSYDYFNEKEIKNLPTDYLPKSEHKVNAGDVIISRMNTKELVGAAGYVWKIKDNIYIPDRLWKANLKNNVNPIFIWQLLVQAEMKEKIKKICSGTSGSMKNISKEKFLKLKVKDVPIELQNKFAEFVKQIDKQKLEIQKSLEEIQKLQESLMNKYFG